MQVESRGEAWYINPADEKRYYLGRPADAFNLMTNLGVGIANNDLKKIPVGLIAYDDQDDDNDGLPNRLEAALGTDPEKTDTDNDGYADKNEIENNYNPLGTSSLGIDSDFAADNSGGIFLQTQNHGEAWYINPTDKKRYYLGRPADAFMIMRQLSLGISNQNLNKIQASIINYTNDDQANNNSSPITPPDDSNNQSENTDQIISGAASAIRANDKNAAVNYFIPEMRKAIEYTMDFLDDEGRLTLGNILSGAKLSNSTATKKTYSTEVYFSLGGYKVPINFYVKKQPDGSWLMANL